MALFDSSGTRLRADNSPDVKRAGAAKAILAVHKHLNLLVDRGRQILALCGEEDFPSDAVRLLTQQLETLDLLQADLTSEPIADVMTVQLPNVSLGITDDILCKRVRVWARLDAIVGATTDLDAREWVRRLEKAGWGDPPGSYWTNRMHGCVESWSLVRDRGFGPGSEHWSVFMSDEDMASAHALLDDLAGLSERLRVLLAEKFKLEDIL